MNRLYFIEGEYFGKSAVPLHLCQSHPILWLCISCAEIYARFPVEGRRDGAAIWFVNQGCCSKCIPLPSLIVPEIPVIPGSVWALQGDEINNNFPEKVLKRELSLTLTAFERGIL